MCAQFYVDEDTERVLQKLTGRPIAARHGTVRPGDSAAVLTGGSGRYGASQMRWGLPRLAGSGLVINARSESLAEKPMFRDSLKSRRCAVPAGGFMEWNEQKEKVTFSDPLEPVLFLTGIFDLSQQVPRFAVVTRDANASVARYHDRMPLLLSGDGLELWLNGDFEVCFRAEMPVLHAWLPVEQLSMF